MKQIWPFVLCFCMILTGCLTEQDKAAKAAYDNRPQLGVTFVPEWLTENEVILQDVPPESAAAKAGLLPKDIIISFNGQRVTDIHTLNQLELQAQHGETLSIGILRNQRQMTVRVTLQ